MSSTARVGSGSRTVLILDDEEGVLELTACTLRHEGYATIQCKSFDQAAERFRLANGAIDLLIADVTLSDGSGVESAMQLTPLSPNLKVLFMSGYSIEEWSGRDVDLFNQFPRNSVRTILKPFSLSKLVDIVGELIGTAARSEQSPQAAAFGNAGCKDEETS